MDDNTNNDTKDDSNDDCVEVKKEGEDNQKMKGTRKREKKQTSAVWRVFELLNDVVTKDGVKRAKCRWCDEVKNYDSRYGTGNLQRHINKCYRPDRLVVGQMLLGKDKDSLMLKSSKFSKDIFREKLVRAIVIHNLPLSFIETL